MASFNSCPAEIQEAILSYAVVIPRQPMGQVQGLSICDGEAENVLSSVFLVSRSVRQLSQKVALTQNRVVLHGEPAKTLKWLNSRPPALLHRIRRLSFLITEGQLCHPETRLVGWNTLVHAVSEFCTLEKLQLSVDGCFCYESLVDDRVNFEFLKETYRIILAPFAAPPFAALQSFFIFWPQWRSLEALGEKQVKGETYKPLAQGKIPWHERDPRMAHGWEGEIFDENDEFLPEYAEYRSIGMMDSEPGWT